MKKKILFLSSVLTVILLSTPLVVAAPLKDKNNAKFQTFEVNATFPFSNLVTGIHDYIPNQDDVNIMTISFEESFLTYELKIGDNTYLQNEDFIYTGHGDYTFYDVTAWLTILGVLPPYLWPSEYRASHLVVVYTFDFSAVPGGLDGTLQMRAMYNQAGFRINGLAGTGDLQNVQIKGVAETVGTGTVITIHHYGLVSGWPQ